MKCWNCAATMVAKRDDRGHPYEECPKCGATHTDLPPPRADVVTLVRDYFLSPPGMVAIKTPSPSGVLRRQAAKARVKK